MKSNNSSCLGKINFTRNWISLYGGILSLPPILVDDSTGPKFFNLVAYEMCPDFENDYGVSSYISFLDSLIDESKDVIDLRNAGILCNFLGSEDEVAQVFNEIGTDLVPNPEIYEGVKRRIQQYYDKRRMLWITQVIHDHFSSPWAIVAFIVGLFVLILSVLQTVYSMLAYYHSPSKWDKRYWKFVIDPLWYVLCMAMSFRLFTFLLSNSHVRLNKSVWTMYLILNLM